jgi:CPA1 family monovalent cation:H+ antiporter
MHSFEYILIMLGGVLISSLVSRRLPQISTPLVQIAIGGALTLLPLSFEMTLEPELFLVLFIAPLLFEDAKKADKTALWRLKRPILLLAIGLVFATALIVGFSIHWFTPSIPLAAAFALAAALAPTDAVAVASFKETATVSDDQENLLKGESLLNDASGIVSFQFAIAAALTGTFSLLSAGVSFLLTFFGGLAVGIVLMLLRLRIVRLRSSGTENITFHVLFEVVTPFLIYLVAEALHVSGIIAVVAAGVTFSFSRRPQTPSIARHNIVSTSVWAVLSFTLNGLVFLILGTQLPSVVQRVWSSSAAADYFLVVLIVLILLGILLIRFVWVLVMRRRSGLAPRPGRVSGLGEEVEAGENGENNENDGPADVEAAVSAESNVGRRAEGHAGGASWRTHVHDAVLLSLTGAKGAITLALVLTIPLTLADGTPFPERDLIIFLASGVILLSLLVANFVVPLIAPKKAAELKPEHEVEAVLDVYRSVIGRLIDSAEPETKAASEEVAQQYYERIRKAKTQNDAINDLDVLVRMRLVEWEWEHTLELIEQGEVSALTGMAYLDHLSRIRARLRHHNAVGWEIKGFFEQLARRFQQRRQQRARMRQGEARVRQAWEQGRTRQGQGHMQTWSQDTGEEVGADVRADAGTDVRVDTGAGALPDVGADARAHTRADVRRPSVGRRNMLHGATRKASQKAARREAREKARLEFRDLIVANYRYVQGKLEEHASQEAEDKEYSRVAALVLIEIERRIARLDIPRGSLSSVRQEHERQLLEVEARALELEREAINDALDHKRISRATAKEMRDNVAMMELDIEEQLE